MGSSWGVWCGSVAPLMAPSLGRSWGERGSVPGLAPRGPPVSGPSSYLLPTPRSQDSHMGVGVPRTPGQEGTEGVHLHCLSMTRGADCKLEQECPAQ